LDGRLEIDGPDDASAFIRQLRETETLKAGLMAAEIAQRFGRQRTNIYSHCRTRSGSDAHLLPPDRVRLACGFLGRRSDRPDWSTGPILRPLLRQFMGAAMRHKVRISKNQTSIGRRRAPRLLRQIIEIQKLREKVRLAEAAKRAAPVRLAG